jgi:nucleotide-binding universal stress UspA family protein
MYQRILVPIDGSPTSNLGIREALKLAREQKSRLRLVHVVDELVIMSSPDAIIPVDDVIGSLRDAGKNVLEKSKKLVERAGAQADTVLVERFGGRAADSIVSEAKKWRADLIVLGTHGRRGMRRMVLGSDAEEVVRSSPVPVLLVRSKAEDTKRSSRRGR